MTASNPISGSASETGDTPIFTASIRPHRSLTGKGQRLVVTLACIATIVSSIPFVIAGAWPVAGFFGLDLAALVVALHVNTREGRAVEEIAISRVSLLIRHIDWRGRVAEWHANPLWTRLERADHPEFGATALAFVSRGERRDVGLALSGPERADLGDKLRAALARVKSGY